MPLLLTCECGARFEVDDHFGHRVVSCPECLQTVNTGSRRPTPRTDWLALFGVALALFGAFTVVGTLAAAVAGTASLVRIRRRPDTLSGRGFALAGLGLGLSLTTLTMYQPGGGLPIGAWVRRLRLTGQLDAPTGALGSRDGFFLFPRMPAGWSVLTRTSSGDPAVDDLQQRKEVVLANPALRAFADLQRDADNDEPLPLFLDHLRRDLSTPRKPLLGDDDEENPLRASPTAPADLRISKLPAKEGLDGHEWTFDLPRGGTTWRFLVRLYRKPRQRNARASPTYVLRVYAPRDTFRAAEGDLRAIADGVRFSP
ncbi:MAG: hypothetical protein U0797_26880 [Gemmataceae bacterium]